MSFQDKKTVSSLLAIAAGVVTSFCLGVVLLYISAMMIGFEPGIGGWILFIAIGIGIPAFSGGFVCGYYSSQKAYINVLITALILILILLINNDFRIYSPVERTLMAFSLVILFTLLGGFVAFRTKKSLTK